MPRKGANISLSSYDDIFETDESRADSQLEKVQKIPISELVPFKNHPFKVVDDEAMLRTTESIAQFGVLTPLIARPLEDGGYEIISGHRRAHAAEAAGLMRRRAAGSFSEIIPAARTSHPTERESISFLPVTTGSELYRAMGISM